MKPSARLPRGPAVASGGFKSWEPLLELGVRQWKGSEGPGRGRFGPGHELGGKSRGSGDLAEIDTEIRGPGLEGRVCGPAPDRRGLRCI